MELRAHKRATVEAVSWSFDLVHQTLELGVVCWLFSRRVRCVGRGFVGCVVGGFWISIVFSWLELEAHLNGVFL